MRASGWRRLAWVAGVLAGLVVFSAQAAGQVPLLGKEGEDLELPEGWEFCHQQDPDIIQDPQNAKRFRAARWPSESGRNTYQVYIRAKEIAGECRSVPVRFFGKSAPTPGPRERGAAGQEQPVPLLPRGMAELGRYRVMSHLPRTGVAERSEPEEELPVVRLLVPARKDQRKKAMLPSSYAACESSDEAIGVDPDRPHELTLKANVERGRTVEILGVRSTDGEAKCPAEPGGDREEGKLERILVRFIPPVLQPAAQSITLGWSKEAPQYLSIYVKDPLVADEVLRAETQLIVSGLQAPGAWAGPCISYNLCEYRIEAVHDWKRDSRPYIRTASSKLQQAFEEGEVFDFEGHLIQESAFEPIEVHRWMAPRMQQNVLQVLAEQLKHADSGLVLPLEDPLAWLMAPGSVKCPPPQDSSVCAMVEHPSEAQPRASLRLYVSDDLRALLQTRDLDLKIPLRQNIQLVDQNTLEELPQKELSVKVRQRRCEYRIQQLTQAFAGLSDGWVYYGVQPVDKSTCPTYPSWTVKTDSTAVRLTPNVETLREDLVRVHFEALPETPPKPAVTVQFMVTEALKVESSGSPLTLTIQPRLAFKLKKIVTSLHEAFGLDGAGPPEDGPTLEGQLIGLERANWLFLEAPFIKNWSLELVSSNVLPCHVTENSETRSLQLLPFREQALCLAGVKEGTEDLVLQAELLGPPSDFMLEGVVAPKGLKDYETRQGSSRYSSLGSMTLRWPVKTGYVRLAYSLRELARLKCGGVEVSSDMSYRAVDFGNESSRRCTINFWLPLEAKIGAMLESQGASLSGEEMQEIYDDVLEMYGRQRFKVELATADTAKREFTTVGKIRPAIIELQAGERFTGYQDRRLVVEPEQQRLGVSVDFDFLQAGTLSIPDYGLLRLQVSHENPSDFVSNDLRSKKEPFVAHVSRMPDNTFPGLAYTFGWEKRPGWGLRGNATFTIPAKLFRTRHNGFNVKTSSQFAKLQSAEFGAGMLYSVEFWDYDNIEPVLDFGNPQLQAGFLLNTNLNTLELPRISLVAGLGLRLPGGTAPTSVVESKPGLIVWYELSKGRVQRLEHSVLVGIQLNFVTVGN